MLIYLAGPIRQFEDDGEQIHLPEENIRIAKAVALGLWQKGYAVICPHANTDLPIEIAEKEVDERVWLDGDFEMLARCDALVVLHDWEYSRGTKSEIKFAEEHQIPVYYLPDLPVPSVTESLRPEQCKGFMEIIMNMYRVHLRKNSDYSPANILGAGEIGLVTRIWDKVTRLMNLTGFRIEISDSEFEQPSDPKNESKDDTYLDTAVYGVIGLLYRAGKWGK